MSQQLNKNSDTFAAAGWSGTGFGVGEDMEIGVEFPRVVNGLDQSAAGSLESLVINPTARGMIGGPDGALIFDCANSADAKVQNLGKVDAYLSASTKVENMHTGNPKARTRLLSGEFETTSISSGRMSAAASVVIDELIATGGSTFIAYSATAITTAHLMKGRTHLQRKATTIIVGQDAVLDLDPDTLATWTSAKIFLYGGTVNVYGGEVPSIEAYGGVIDFRFARQAIGTGFGVTQYDVAGTIIRGHPSVNTTAPTTIGGIARSDGSPTEFSGGTSPAPD